MSTRVSFVGMTFASSSAVMSGKLRWRAPRTWSSRQKYDLLHVRGARHLNFSDITAAELAKVIPTKDTRVLIYCNNNFENEEQAFAVKTAGAALNVHTFNVLHAYGYTNVHELKPLLDVRTTRMPFAGTAADARGRYAKR